MGYFDLGIHTIGFGGTGISTIGMDVASGYLPSASGYLPLASGYLLSALLSK
ncbi:hypothetical protein PAXRUDRAFT_16874 [Paxillus rubicundulus Ve08.2h10]|uniref:Uncharacterized protein n=1 Tax=Paxillus rubicundulus Ve08.2h10 TaxID=930991 RepID=A0A0D0D4D8_9AGAM|nr:hypothetical protein PAXRUDRAFT_16874 [Paxillus rubicundulus Ve08.2h10]